MSTASPDQMKGPGILFVVSKIARDDILDEATYMKWYADDHIAEIIQTSGIKSARTFKDIDPKADKPFLAMYPMDDIGFTQGDEFRKIRVKSDMLPGSGIVYDLADIDVRYDNLIQVFDRTKKGKGATKSLLVSAIELKSGVSEDEFNDWYKTDHCERLAKHKNFLRCTRFRLVYARTNAQSRVLKGLAPPTDEPPPNPLTFLNLHEFDCPAEELDRAEIEDLIDDPARQKMVENFDKREVSVYNLTRDFGERDWFYGVEM